MPVKYVLARNILVVLSSNIVLCLTNSDLYNMHTDTHTYILFFIPNVKNLQFIRLKTKNISRKGQCGDNEKVKHLH